MMLRGLVDEVVRRRLWPIPLIALLVAAAAPLLFMKSPPSDAPAATAAPPVPAPGELPVSAEKLLAKTDKAVVVRKSIKRKGQDPFQPPRSAKVAVMAKETAETTGEDGAATAIAVDASSTGGSTSSSATATAPPPPPPPSSSGTTSSASSSTTTTTTTQPRVAQTVAFVDVRFGKTMGTMLRYRVPQLQTFRAGGKVAAMFLGYSKPRDKAVFAIAPSTQVSGAKCRKLNGVCRYVELRAGDHARLALVGEDGRVASRRLDVVSIRHLPTGSKASKRATSFSVALCLLRRLQRLSPSAPSISTDSCA